jgi:hypothetical protein
MKIFSKALETAIKTVTSVTGTPEISIICNKELSVFSTSEGKYAKVVINTKAVGKWKTRISSDVLFSLLKGSAEADIEMKNDSTLSVKVKNMTGSIKTMPYEEPPTIERGGESKKITEKNQLTLVKALSAVGITDIHADGNSTFVFVNIDNSKMIVSRFDTFHMAFFESSEVKGKEKIDMTVAIDSFDTVARVAGKNSYVLSLGDTLKAWNDWFEVQLPLIQSEDIQNMDTVKGLIKQLNSEKSANSFTANVDEVFEALEKCSGVFEVGSSVAIKSEKDCIKLSIKTSFGQVETKVSAKVKGKISASLDPYLVIDTLRPMEGKELHLQFNDSMAYTRVKVDDRISTYAFVLVK